MHESLVELSSSWHSGAGRGLCCGGRCWVEEPDSGTHGSQQLRAQPPFLGESPRPAVQSQHTKATCPHSTSCVGRKSSGCDMVMLERPAQV